jgi:hypothetical protein
LVLVQASLAELPQKGMHSLHRDHSAWVALILGAEGLNRSVSAYIRGKKKKKQ